MLEKCKLSDFRVGDIFYFQWWFDKKLNGPFLVLGWSEKLDLDQVTIHKERKESHKCLVEINISRAGPMRGIGFMDLDNDNDLYLTFYKSDVILLQENA